MGIRRALCATAAIAALGTLAACGGSSGVKPAATVSATVIATTSVPAVPGVKLSTKWVPKLTALGNGDGVAACQTSGSTGCVRAMTDDLNAFTGILADIDAAGARTEYVKTVAEINQLVRAADAYDKAGCPGDPNADVDGSPCYGNAATVTVGVSTLSFVLPTDELNAGVN